jgi:hypothetical protein
MWVAAVVNPPQNVSTEIFRLPHRKVCCSNVFIRRAVSKTTNDPGHHISRDNRNQNLRSVNTRAGIRLQARTPVAQIHLLVGTNADSVEHIVHPRLNILAYQIRNNQVIYIPVNVAQGNTKM